MAASFVASTFGQLRAGSRIPLLLLLLLVSPLVGAVNIWLTALLNTLLPLIMQQQWQLQRQMAAASAMRFLSAQDKAASILSLLLTSPSLSLLPLFPFLLFQASLSLIPSLRLLSAPLLHQKTKWKLSNEPQLQLFSQLFLMICVQVCVCVCVYMSSFSANFHLLMTLKGKGLPAPEKPSKTGAASASAAATAAANKSNFGKFWKNVLQLKL